jgi:hypothetical protein
MALQYPGPSLQTSGNISPQQISFQNDVRADSEDQSEDSQVETDADTSRMQLWLLDLLSAIA